MTRPLISTLFFLSRFLSCGFPMANHKVMRQCDDEGKPRPSVLLVNVPWCDQQTFSLFHPTLEHQYGVYRMIAVPKSLAEADNTVREAKNQFCLTYLHLLAAQHRFRVVALCHLRKSHTHCRIGTGGSWPTNKNGLIMLKLKQWFGT